MAADTALAPERISIKRRRQEEPVETLYLEHGTGPARKRRVTDFYFQRLRDDVIAPLSQRETPAPQTKPTAPGIPSVRWTSPGDEKKDFDKLKATLKAKEEKETKAEVVSHSTLSDERSQSAPSTPAATTHARRFHLTRHLASVLSPNASGGIRKAKNAIRPPLATFVERQTAAFIHEQNPLYRAAPIDKVLEIAQGDDKEPSIDVLTASTRRATNTFVQAEPQTPRTGTSIRDHPSTWDHQSDQLADELAALAMELDPDVREGFRAEEPSAPAPTLQDVTMTSRDREEDFIYETYVRVEAGAEAGPATTVEAALSNVGILVIEDEDEDLWQKYLDSDDDSDWDEEDSNAEDNPSNDYPEDEVSSDDEFGYHAYKYRHGGSDDEAFDEEKDESDNKW